MVGDVPAFCKPYGRYRFGMFVHRIVSNRIAGNHYIKGFPACRIWEIYRSNFVCRRRIISISFLFYLFRLPVPTVCKVPGLP